VKQAKESRKRDALQAVKAIRRGKRGAKQSNAKRASGRRQFVNRRQFVKNASGCFYSCFYFWS
jgi:hypothetical protein